MALLIILLVASVLVASLMAFIEIFDRFIVFVGVLVVCLIVSGGIFGVFQAIGWSKGVKVENVTYPVKIVSLNDGTGIEGSLYSGLFVTRGSINDTQHFSYYRDTGNGGYALEKRDAGASTIHLDATPATARVDVTDEVTTCSKEKSWWYIGCNSSSAVFVHADFHVPINSIKNEFELDAQ